MTLDIRRDVPLAPFTSLELGGPARCFLEAPDEPTLVAAVRWARERRMPVFLLGGGSNVVVGDGGFDGLVVRLALSGTRWEGSATEGLGSPRAVAAPAPREAAAPAVVTVAAGREWDEFVAETIDRDLAGLECLSGIPGTVGAAPVQNVGAYGQEAADTIAGVRVLDLTTLDAVDMTAAECAFGYRDSRFKRLPGRYAVLSVAFALRPDGAPTLVYPELEAELSDRAPGLREVRRAVLAMRRRKSMLLDPRDENHRSVGSFFTNPVVSPAQADRAAARAADAASGPRAGAAPSGPGSLPRYPTSDGRVKLSAAWLIEHAGFTRGFHRGRVGISTNHTLALVNRGGATTEELLALAADVRAGVLDRFGVVLEMEAVCVGCAPPWRGAG